MIKKSPSIAPRASLAFALCVLASAPVPADGRSGALPEEAPSSLFSTKLGDDDVEVLAEGFWEASVLSSGALSAGDGGTAFSAVPFLFTQMPDLYVLLKFKQRWWFEAYVTEAAEDATFALGFEGAESDFVKDARVGNSGLRMADYPYLSFGEPEGSFGFALHAYDEASGAGLDALVRWDGLSWKTRSFFGMAESSETAIDPGDQVRGRRFVLSHDGVTNLVLVDTTTSRSRALSADEYSVSLATGVILLDAEPEGTLTAFYSAGGSAREETLYEYGVDADGDEIRVDNAREARNLYALTDSSGSRQLFVRDRATGLADTGFEVSRVGAGLVQVTVSGYADENDPAFMRPFGADSGIYGDDTEDAADAPSSAGYAIVARTVESVDAIVLDADTVAGTISVYRDGVESDGFEYDPDTRVLTLTPRPRAGEDIDVRYAESSSDRSDGALAFGVGARFPWLGLRWATAIGGRWPLFGLGYDEEGALKEAWAGLSAQAELETERLSLLAKAMLRYSRAGASGLYRVVGMDDYAAYACPLRLVNAPAGVTASSIVDAELAEAFPDLLDALHPAGATNRALAVTADGASTDIELIRYVESAPLASFGVMSFFVRRDGATAGAALSLSVGDGQGGGVTVSVPLDDAGDGWVMVSVALDPASPKATLTRPDGSSSTLTASAASYDPSSAAGLVALTITGLADGAVYVDEIALSEPVDGLSALGGLSFFLGDRQARGAPYLSVEASGLLDEDPSAAATATAALALGPSSWLLSANPAWADDAGSLGLGYSLAVPDADAATRLTDEYSRDVALGSYARSMTAALSLGGLSALAHAGSAEEAGGFSQDWKASLAYGNAVSVKAALSLDAEAEVLGELGPGEAWLESWALALPSDAAFAEAALESRRMSCQAELAGSALSLELSRELDASDPALHEIRARASLPFRLGLVSVTPYYERATESERATSSTTLRGDAGELLAEAGSALALWSAWPLAELWDSAAFDAFDGFASGAVSASHEAKAGLALKRPLGYGELDLVAPYALEASVARLVESDGDGAEELYSVGLGLSSGAANVFAAGGSRPLLTGVAFDEYSGVYRLSLDWYPSDGAVLPTLVMNHAASFELGMGSALNATSAFSYAMSRSAAPWSETLSLVLTAKPARTWFGDLVGLAIEAAGPRPTAAAAGPRAEAPGPRSPDAAAGAEAGAEPGAGGSSSWVSDWLSETLSRRPVLRSEYDLSCALSRASSVSAPLVERLSLSYSTRATASERLTVGVSLGLSQSARIYETGVLWGFSYEMGIEAKVVF